MNKAITGLDKERFYTSKLNKENLLWANLPFEKSETYAIHITSKKYGKINQAMINCKADIFLAKGKVDNEYLIINDYYLDENDCVKFNLKPLDNSGISVKLPNSKFTYFKTSPHTFCKLFEGNMLACGASIYSTMDFHKNKDVLSGWQISEKDFNEYFSKLFPNFSTSLENKIWLKEIKTYSNKQIHDIICKNKELQDFIFKGIGNFDEPYTAQWIIENNELTSNKTQPFIITTGSGRSKGVYTIVVKPVK